MMTPYTVAVSRWTCTTTGTSTCIVSLSMHACVLMARTSNVITHWCVPARSFYKTCPVRFGVCATAKNADGSIQGTVYMTGGNAGELRGCCTWVSTCTRRQWPDDEELHACCSGRSLANPSTQLLELNPAYSAFASLAYNGTSLPDTFAPANGGYYVNASTTVYGYQRLFANATTLTVQVCMFPEPHIVLHALFGALLLRCN